MYCPNCGQQVPDTAKFCPYCGQTLSHPQNQNPSYQNHQPQSNPNINININNQ